MIYYLFLGGFQGGPLCEIQNESWKPLFEHFWPPQERSEAILKGDAPNKKAESAIQTTYQLGETLPLRAK